MENKDIPSNINQNYDLDQDEIMNRVNQSFDKIAQDVKELIDQNNQQNNL
jgi:ClpP class serine protease